MGFQLLDINKSSTFSSTTKTQILGFCIALLKSSAGLFMSTKLKYFLIQPMAINLVISCRLHIELLKWNLQHLKIWNILLKVCSYFVFCQCVFSNVNLIINCSNYFYQNIRILSFKKILSIFTFHIYEITNCIIGSQAKFHRM